MCNIERLAEDLVNRGIALEPFLRSLRYALAARALHRHQGNHSKTARELGVHRRTLKRILDEGPEGAPVIARRLSRISRRPPTR